MASDQKITLSGVHRTSMRLRWRVSLRRTLTEVSCRVSHSDPTKPNVHYSHAVEPEIRRAEESDCNRMGWEEEGAGDSRRSRRNLVAALVWK